MKSCEDESGELLSSVILGFSQERQHLVVYRCVEGMYYLEFWYVPWPEKGRCVRVCQLQLFAHSPVIRSFHLKLRYAEFDDFICVHGYTVEYRGGRILRYWHFFTFIPHPLRFSGNRLFHAVNFAFSTLHKGVDVHPSGLCGIPNVIIVNTGDRIHVLVIHISNKCYLCDNSVSPTHTSLCIPSCASAPETGNSLECYCSRFQKDCSGDAEDCSVFLREEFSIDVENLIARMVPQTQVPLSSITDYECLFVIPSESLDSFNGYIRCLSPSGEVCILVDIPIGFVALNSRITIWSKFEQGYRNSYPTVLLEHVHNIIHTRHIWQLNNTPVMEKQPLSRVLHPLLPLCVTSWHS